MSKVLPVLMLLRVQHSIKSGQFLSLDRGSIDLTEDALESGKVWPCTFSFTLAFIMTSTCDHRHRRTSCVHLEDNCVTTSIFAMPWAFLKG